MTMEGVEGGATTEYQLDLPGHETISNSDVWADDGIASNNVSADFGLRVTRVPPEDGQFDFVLFGPLITSQALNQSGISRRSTSDVFGAVEECRKEWKGAVVDLTRSVSRGGGKPVFEHSFQERWDFKDEPSLLNSLAPRLALAGDKLFNSIFELDCDDCLPDVARTLRTLLRTSRYIAVTSAKFFLPWGMLYTHPAANEELYPDGSNWDKRGFWGYQHIIQHSPEAFDTESRIRPNSTGEVALSVNFDDRLSVALKLPSIEEHIKSVSALGGQACIRRTTKREIAAVFVRERASLEPILYFYCHGHGSSSGGLPILSSPCLKFTDGDISASDFKNWAKGKKLPTKPLVMINACQGGQMTTLFYESFANELLKEGAIGLIGAQIDVPAVFASAYGQLLLTDFFSRDEGVVRLGPLMRSVNQRMWDKYNNPLGLVYSLYRGVDCFIDWPKPT